MEVGDAGDAMAVVSLGEEVQGGDWGGGRGRGVQARSPMPAGEARAPGGGGRGGQVQGDLCKIPGAWGCLNIGERSTDQEPRLQRRWEGVESGTKEEKLRLILDI